MKHRGHVISLVLVLGCAAALQVDWLSLFFGSQLNVRKRAPAVVALPSTQAVEFLKQQYQNAYQEIQSRLEQESALFALKFTLVGAVLALIFTVAVRQAPEQKPDASSSATESKTRYIPEFIALFCWAAVVTSAIVDTRIFFHANSIQTLGIWVRDHVEPVIYAEQQATLVGWEQYLASSSDLMTTKSYPLLRLNASLLTFTLFTFNVLIFSSSILLPVKPGDESESMRRVCQFATACSFGVFFLIGVHFHYSRWWWLLLCAGLAFLGGGSALVLFSRKT